MEIFSFIARILVGWQRTRSMEIQKFSPKLAAELHNYFSLLKQYVLINYSMTQNLITSSLRLYRSAETRTLVGISQIQL